MKKTNKKTNKTITKKLPEDNFIDYSSFVADFSACNDERTGLNNNYDGTTQELPERYQQQPATIERPDTVQDMIQDKNIYTGYNATITGIKLFFDTYKPETPLAYSLITLCFNYDNKKIEYTTRANAKMLYLYMRDSRVSNTQQLPGKKCVVFFSKNIKYLNTFICFTKSAIIDHILYLKQQEEQRKQAEDALNYKLDNEYTRQLLEDSNPEE